MPPKRRNQGSLALPAELADRIAAEGGGGGGSGGGGSDKRYTKRFKNAAGARKAARKQAREDKKQRRNTHHKREHGFAPPAAPARGQPASGAAPGRPRQPAKQPASKPAAAPAPPSDGRAQLVKFAKRNQGMYALLRESNLVDNVDNEAGVAGAAEGAEELEDREMRRLEKHLGIKSNAKLAAAFHDEGLGEILSGINYGSSKVRSTSGPSEPARPAAAEADSDPDLGEDGSDDDDDDAFGLNDASDDGSESDDSDVADMYRRQGINIDVELSDADGADNDSATDSNDDAAADSDSDSASDSGSDSASDSDDGGDHASVLDSDSDMRMADESTAVARDSVPAAVAASVSKYIPPSLRGKQSDESEDERMAAIRKTLRGQINRLSESNIEGIVLQIEAQYEKYPRGFVTEVLADLILQAIQSRIHMLDTFLFVNAAVVGAVYRLVGLEPVAHLVQKLMEEFERQFARGMADFKAGAGLDAAEDEVAAGKECQNLCVFVAELYNFQIVSCRLVYDVIRLCIQDVNEFTAELLLKLIRISGQQLRKDDPLALKEIVRQVADTVGRAGGGQLSVRCKFMVESLT
ncbi:suppressor of glycerol defect, partial [Coemansia helicoidea]